MNTYKIWFDREIIVYFLDLKKEFSMQNIEANIIETNDNYYFLVTYDTSKTDEVKEQILLKIKDVIFSFYKPKYILKNLKTQCPLQDYKSLFLQTLVNFERGADLKAIEQKFEFKNQLFLSSFYKFKLKSLQKKWIEICELTNENLAFLFDEKVLLDLIKFLLLNVMPTENQVNICQENNQIVLQNEFYKTVKLKQPFFVNQNNYSELLLTNIIELAPKKINIFCSKNIDAFMLNILNSIYGDNFKIVN